MRLGQNPSKKADSVAKPERITVAVLNYIPFISGFYAEMPNVLKVCLNSLRENTKVPFDLLVFDNGSCPEVLEYLVNEQITGNIQYLMLSEKNLGKGGAWNMILDGAPGEIIAYGDNDIYYKEGWLEESLEILETYPNVGMVTARPFRSQPDCLAGTVEWAEANDDVQVERGCLIPWESYRDFNMSIGNSEEELRELYPQPKDIKLTYKGVEAFVGASHWQFTAYKSVIQQFLPFDMDRPMGQVNKLDQRVNDDGLLRLMIRDSLAVNMSNSLSYVPEVPDLAIPEDAAANIVEEVGGLKAKILAFGPLKKLMLRLYDLIFKWYFGSNTN